MGSKIYVVGLDGKYCRNKILFTTSNESLAELLYGAVRTDHEDGDDHAFLREYKDTESYEVHWEYYAAFDLDENNRPIEKTREWLRPTFEIRTKSNHGYKYEDCITPHKLLFCVNVIADSEESAMNLARNEARKMYKKFKE